MTILLKPLVYADEVHRPMGTGEAIDPATIALSANANNLLHAASDGLYVGSQLDSPVYYISPSLGVDAPTNGSKVAPFATVDYCMAHIASQIGTLPYFCGAATIAMRCGEAYALTNSFACGGQLTFTFWGDPNYGDFDSPYVNSVADPATMQDLARPVFTPATPIATGLASIILVPPLLGGQPSVSLRGVLLSLPHQGPLLGNNDFVVISNNTSGHVDLFGAIVNKSDEAVTYGLMGISSRARPSSLSQYASQFWFLGTPINAPATPAIMLTRQWYIKFYPDLPGNHQQGGSLVSGPAGGGVLQVSWPEITSQLVDVGKFNLATFPTIADVGLGLRNYFYNLTRDQQQRPLNLVASFLLP